MQPKYVGYLFKNLLVAKSNLLNVALPSSSLNALLITIFTCVSILKCFNALNKLYPSVKDVGSGVKTL